MIRHWCASVKMVGTHAPAALGKGERWFITIASACASAMHFAWLLSSCAGNLSSSSASMPSIRLCTRSASANKSMKSR